MNTNRLPLARTKRERLFDGDRIVKGACIHALRASAWWLTHKTGPVLSPGDADNIYDGAFGWTVDYGKNAVCLERAIKRIVESVDSLEIRQTMDDAALADMRDIRFALNRSIIMHDHDSFLDAYPMQKLSGKEFLVFGSHGIELRAFFAWVLRWLEWNDSEVDAVAQMH